jgi:sterol desaturase/sphingolipid hydroxylase (fatty acid hydroxylase superfamily)
VYSPATNSWSLSGGTDAGHVAGAAALLAKGKVVAASANVSEVWDPAAGTWKSAGAFPGQVFGCCALALAPGPAFLLNFVAVDYLYYWNHRLLHTQRFWTTHAVHHSARQADVFITSRNTLWTPLLIVYVWANGALVYLLADPAPFLLAVALTASLDLWRHTVFFAAPGGRLHRLLALVLVTPNEHLWHHSSARATCNFGANLSVWDRLHGTFYSPAHRPASLGIPVRLSLWRRLLFPYAAGPESWR